MIVRNTLDLKVIVRIAWKRMLTLFIIAVLAVLLNQYFGLNHIKIDTLPATVLGTALSILTSFRVNSAYDRWWEARRLWGAIVNDSRTMARQITTFLSYKDEDKAENRTIHDSYVHQMVYRQIAFVYALKNHLRKQDIIPEITPFLPAEDLVHLKTQQNIPNALLQKQAEILQDLQEKGFLDSFRHVQMETKQSTLCDSMGGCERIKNTVFPRQYSVYSSLFIRIYSYCLPFVLVNNSGWFCVPATLVIGFIFYAMDTIASGIENPFENSFNDTPMSAICRTIEINLKQQLGETELPAHIQPVNGFLY
jgi:ion channel-forming bestrophin family protein